MLRVINLQEKYNKANNEADLEDLYKSWLYLAKFTLIQVMKKQASKQFKRPSKYNYFKIKNMERKGEIEFMYLD